MLQETAIPTPSILAGYTGENIGLFWTPGMTYSSQVRCAPTMGRVEARLNALYNDMRKIQENPDVTIISIKDRFADAVKFKMTTIALRQARKKAARENRRAGPDRNKKTDSSSCYPPLNLWFLEG